MKSKKEEDGRLANAKAISKLGQERLAQGRKIDTADVREERLKYEEAWKAHSEKVFTE